MLNNSDVGLFGPALFADVNECNSQPCVVGQSVNCTDEVDGYTCLCVAGYEGILCESGESVYS